MDECLSQFFHTEENGIADISSNATSSQNSSLNSDDSFGLSQLAIEEDEPMRIQPFYNVTPRSMPVSPHYIFEEEFLSNPWAVLVATIFLTKTSGKTARPYIKRFFQEYPTPYDVLGVNPENLEVFFENLGLKKRGQTIWKMSYQFLASKWRRASDLFGIGQYGEEAFRIFYLGHTDLEPSDSYLRLYLDWLRNCTDYIEETSIAQSESYVEDPVLKYYLLR